MAVAKKEKEHENEGEGGRKWGGGYDIAHVSCCLLLSQCCGSWLSTHTCKHPQSYQLNNIQKQKEEKKHKGGDSAPMCHTLH